MSIQVRNIHKSFGSFTALGDVSLDFPTGELTALLGPSGCGKTTLLRIIAGLETADRGQVLLDGADASDTHVREREVGFVFQHYALFRHMTVFENVAFGLRVRPRRTRPAEAQIGAKVTELLHLVQLDRQRVFRQRADQPVPVGVGEGIAVVLVEIVAAGVGVAGDVHPVARPALAVGGAG